MTTALKIVFAIVSLTGIGFCVAFAVEEVLRRAEGAPLAAKLAAEEEDRVEGELIAEAVEKSSGGDAEGSLWKRALREQALAETAFVDNLLEGPAREGELALSVSLEQMESEALESYFVELMARDLEDARAISFAGLALEEIATRAPEAAVALLYALAPAERERLAPSLVQGWARFEPLSAFAWIEEAWVDEAGSFIDRSLQNDLYGRAMESMLQSSGDFTLASRIVEEVADPELQQRLARLVARQVVKDGPERALERLATAEGPGLDQAVMDEIADQWAARDERGAMGWTLANEQEVSLKGVRSIAKRLAIGADEAGLRQFHGDLVTVERRDTVAAEAARLAARRDPIASADWALAIERPETKREAVLNALYEIGYESLEQSVDYVDYVYAPEEADRVPVLFATLRDWVAVDRPAVEAYLLSDRARLPGIVAEELLLLQ